VIPTWPLRLKPCRSSFDEDKSQGENSPLQADGIVAVLDVDRVNGVLNKGLIVAFYYSYLLTIKFKYSEGYLRTSADKFLLSYAGETLKNGNIYR